MTCSDREKKSTLYPYTFTLGWSDFNFLRFFKMGILLLISYIFMSLMQKNRQILPHAGAAHAWQSFHLQKITGTLRMNTFWKVCRNLLLHQEQF